VRRVTASAGSQTDAVAAALNEKLPYDVLTDLGIARAQ
jgi:hypothetical protein